MNIGSKDNVWIFSQAAKTIYQTDGKGQTLNAIKVDPSWSVAGICVTKEEELLVCCKDDRSIKKCTKNGDIIDLINTAPLKPICICTSWSTGEILVGGVDDSVSEEDMFKTGIGRRVVQKYSDSGTLIKEIQFETITQPLFTVPWKIQVDSKGDIAVCNLTSINDGHIILLDKHGRLIFKYFGKADEIIDNDTFKFCPVGLCFDKNSDIVFSEAFSCSVQLINSKGHFNRVLYTDRRSPPSNLVSCANGDLWVGCKGGRVQVLKYA